MKMVDISPYYLEKMVLTLGSTLDGSRIRTAAILNLNKFNNLCLSMA